MKDVIADLRCKIRYLKSLVKEVLTEENERIEWLKTVLPYLGSCRVIESAELIIKEYDEKKNLSQKQWEEVDYLASGISVCCIDFETVNKYTEMLEERKNKK